MPVKLRMALLKLLLLSRPTGNRILATEKLADDAARLSALLQQDEPLWKDFAAHTSTPTASGAKEDKP